MEITVTTTHVFFFANLIFCAAYVVRDMLKLRALTIVAAALTLPYFFFQSEPLWSAILWQTAFGLINAVNLGILINERRPVAMGDHERRVHNLSFRSLTARELMRLLRIAEWQQLETGEVLIRRNETCKYLYLVYSGVLRVTVDSRTVAHLRDGQFAGEMSYLTGHHTSADVIANQPTQVIAWPKPELDRFFDRHTAIRNTVHSILGFDMAGKLKIESE